LTSRHLAFEGAFLLVLHLPLANTVPKLWVIVRALCFHPFQGLQNIPYLDLDEVSGCPLSKLQRIFQRQADATHLFGTKRFHWIDRRGAARGDEAGQ
jgi:hypothetical protein